MFTVSISVAEANPTPTPAASRSRAAASSERRGAATSLESLMPLTQAGGRRTSQAAGRMTAAATTGPKRDPRPTSSMPAIRRTPSRASSFSSRKLAATDVASALVLFEAGRLALEVAQVVELGPADTGLAHDLDRLDHLGMEGEDALDADAERDLADREGGLGPAAALADDVAAEDLDALLVAFPDDDVDLDGVADVEGHEVLLELFILERADDGHDFFLSFEMVFGQRSGRSRAVFSRALARRHVSIFPWSPEKSTAGTFKPRNSRGRVYCG